MAETSRAISVANLLLPRDASLELLTQVKSAYNGSGKRAVLSAGGSALVS